MTIRDKIMDKYWSEFLVSSEFNRITQYSHTQPLEPTFWEWFKDNCLTQEKPKSLEALLEEK